MGLPAIKIKRRGVVAKRAETKDELNGESPKHSALDILFSSKHNIHKSSCGLCFWASGLLNGRFY